MIDSLKKLLKKLAPWFEVDIPAGRLSNDAAGRTWFITAIEYAKTLKLEDLRKVTDRSSLNKEFRKRYEVKDQQAKKGISAIKIEISALYSFNRCFVQRYKGRMHFYVDDLSQKGGRNTRTVGQSFGVFEEFKANLD